jgi:hypothetical protein
MLLFCFFLPRCLCVYVYTVIIFPFSFDISLSFLYFQHSCEVWRSSSSRFSFFYKVKGIEGTSSAWFIAYLYWLKIIKWEKRVGASINFKKNNIMFPLILNKLLISIFNVHDYKENYFSAYCQYTSLLAFIIRSLRSLFLKWGFIFVCNENFLPNLLEFIGNNLYLWNDLRNTLHLISVLRFLFKNINSYYSSIIFEIYFCA